MLSYRIVVRNLCKIGQYIKVYHFKLAESRSVIRGRSGTFTGLSYTLNYYLPASIGPILVVPELQQQPFQSLAGTSRQTKKNAFNTKCIR